jgi:iron complex outermembrane receptor protein
LLQGTNPTTTYAGFGQVSIKLPAGFQLQLGGRYSSDTTANNVQVLQFGAPIADIQKASFSDFTYKATLNWNLNANNFLYGFVATGFKPGGLNVPVGLGQPAPFTSETVTNYEVGWKATAFDGHIRTQLDAYYNDYKNFQVIVGYPAIPVFGIELNDPNPTKMYGVEGEVQAVFGPLSIDAGIGLMHSSLGTFFATDPRIVAFASCSPTVGPASASCINLSGHQQTYAPDFTFNFGVQYDFTLSGGDTLTPRVNFGHISSQWATLFDNTALGDRLADRDILGAQLAWVHKDIVTTLYGTNLTDQHYVGAINTGLRFAGPPRQFGIRVLKLF